MKITRGQNLFLLAIALINFSACSERTHESQSTPFKFDMKNYSTLGIALDNAKISCDASGCPDNVGIVLNTKSTAWGKSTGQCTGFLIAETIVATNSHCISDEVKLGQDCSNKLGIAFSKGDASGRRSFLCKKFIGASDISNTFNPDYAFFEIDQTQREILKISKAGLNDSQNIKVYKIDPTPSGGSLIKAECELVQGSLINLKAATPWSRLQLAAKCQAKHGNSGSPVLNMNNELVGIVQSYTTPETLNYLNTQFANFGIRLETTPPHFNFANFSCIKDPATLTAQEEKCLADEKLNVTSGWAEYNRSHNTENIKFLTSLIEGWARKLEPIFKYDFSESTTFSGYNADPECVLTKEQSSSKFAYSTYVKSTGFIKKSESIEFAQPSELEYAVKIQTDEHYRLLPILILPAPERSVVFNLKKNGENWIGISRNMSRTGQFSNQKNIKVPECTDERAAKDDMKGEPPSPD